MMTHPRLLLQCSLILTGIGIASIGFSLLNNSWSVVHALSDITRNKAIAADASITSVSSAANLQSGPTKVMIVGDSISHGASGDWTWRYRLWQHFVADGIANDIDFVGPRDKVIDPTASTWVENYQYNDPNFDREHDASAGRKAADEKNTIAGYVQTYMPNILLINLGTNDLGSTNAYGQTVDGQMAANTMSQLITNARSANPNVKIVLSKITPNIYANPSYWTDYNNRLASMATTMSTTASPIVLADPTPGYDPTPTADTFDGVHPTPSGEYKIAAAFANALSGGFGIGTPYGAIPPAPAWPLATRSLSAPQVGSDSVVLSWDLAAGVNQYYVYMRQAGTGPFTRISPLVKGTSYTVAPLTSGMYEFAVASVRGSVTGSLSASIQIEILPRTRPPIESDVPPMPEDDSSRTRPPSDAPPTPGTSTEDGRTRPGSTVPSFP